MHDFLIKFMIFLKQSFDEIHDNLHNLLTKFATFFSLPIDKFVFLLRPIDENEREWKSSILDSLLLAHGVFSLRKLIFSRLLKNCLGSFVFTNRCSSEVCYKMDVLTVLENIFETEIFYNGFLS